MKGVERINALFTTEKQRAFDKDFLSGWEEYDVWEEIEVGRPFQAAHDYLVTQEDVLYYNRTMGETDPELVDAKYAESNSPSGNVVVHPLFLVSMLFYCLGSKGPGTWLRTPGAMNPFQDIELNDPILVGDKIRLQLTTVDRFVRRGKHYITNLNEFSAGDGNVKVRAWATLIVPPSRDEIRKFINA